jgi:N-acetyl-beta-hexosaminidase
VITNVTAYSPLHVYASADLVDLIQYARLRGVVIYPEIDLPEHSYTLIQAIPDIGCFVPTPAPGYRCLLDPLYPQLWPTLKAIWSAMDEAFPKAYPFHMGGDEVRVLARTEGRGDAWVMLGWRWRWC